MKISALLTLAVGLIAAYILFVPRLNFHLRAASNAKISKLKNDAQTGDISALKELAKHVTGRNGANAVGALAQVVTNLNRNAAEKFVVPAFVEALTSDNPATRRQAALSAESLVRSYPRELIPALSHMATNDDPAQAFHAIEAIPRAGDYSVDPLIAIARHYQTSTFMPGGGFDYRTPKAVAFQELSSAAPLRPEAQAIFRSGLQDRNRFVQFWAAVGLFNGGSRELADSKFVELLDVND